MHLSFAYRTVPYTSYWGPTNSQSNFCEEDHIITAYIAEFINTLTNVTYLLYAYHGIKLNWNRKDAMLRSLPYLGIAGVGIGSTVFHATMKNYTQWCDDLSMLIAVSTVLHRVFTFDKSLAVAVSSGLTMAVLIAGFITWHCIVDEALVHCVLFGIMVVVVGNKTRRIIKARVPDPALRKQLRILGRWGTSQVFFGSGFVLWNIDNAICASLTATKRSMGMPWAFILELHGWWHILTGIGAYIFIALVEYLTSEEAGQPLGTNFAWPVSWLIYGSMLQKKSNKNNSGTVKLKSGKGKKIL